MTGKIPGQLDLGGEGSVSLAVDGPPAGRRVVLAHGAGGSLRSAAMERLAARLAARHLLVIRFNFPYSENGRRAPDRAAVLLSTWRAAALELGGERAVLGGKSMGGRYATMLLAGEDAPPAAGCVLFGYPLHPPGKPDQLRTAHLSSVRVPMLFLAGTRDAFARLDLLKETVAALPLASLHVVDGATHDFTVTGRRSDDVLDELCDVTARFVASDLG